MITRLTQYFMVLLIGVPMYLCCQVRGMTAAPAAAVAAECSGCHKFAEPEEAPATPAPEKGCVCCDGLLQRNLSPDITSAPRLVLVDLQAWVRVWSEDLLPPSWREHCMRVNPAVVDHGPPRHAVPLFIQHCALLT